MLKRFALVVLLGLLGLAAGFTYGVLFPSFGVGDALVLPADSPRSAMDLVTVTRGDHPGVLITSHGRIISFSATGSLGDADRAVALANQAVVAANNGKVKAILRGLPAPLYQTSRYALTGLLAGLVPALGFLVPRRRRVTSTA
ncbi:MAG TPA: hypothetical protein VF834_24425 [Streptosporangiaceae bacterium]